MVFTIADYVIIGFILLFAIIGFFKGFISAIISLLNGVLALVIAYFLAPYLTEVFHNTPMNGFFHDMLYNWVIGKGEAFSQPIPEGGITEALATELNLPDFLINFLNELIGNNSDIQGMVLGEYIAATVTHYILVIISFVLLSIAAKILLSIIAKLLRKLVEHGGAIILINRLLGLCVGVIKAILIICIIFWIAEFISPWIGSVDELIVNYINPDNPDFGVARWLYNNNFINLIIDKLLNPESIPVA